MDYFVYFFFLWKVISDLGFGCAVSIERAVPFYRLFQSMFSVTHFGAIPQSQGRAQSPLS
jgi:hypothetical protein